MHTAYQFLRLGVTILVFPLFSNFFLDFPRLKIVVFVFLTWASKSRRKTPHHHAFMSRRICCLRKKLASLVIGPTDKKSLKQSPSKLRYVHYAVITLIQLVQSDRLNFSRLFCCHHSNHKWHFHFIWIFFVYLEKLSM